MSPFNISEVSRSCVGAVGAAEERGGDGATSPESGGLVVVMGSSVVIGRDDDQPLLASKWSGSGLCSVSQTPFSDEDTEAL